MSLKKCASNTKGILGLCPPNLQNFDPDPASKNNADPCGRCGFRCYTVDIIASRTIRKTFIFCRTGDRSVKWSALRTEEQHRRGQERRGGYIPGRGEQYNRRRPLSPAAGSQPWGGGGGGGGHSAGEGGGAGSHPPGPGGGGEISYKQCCGSGPLVRCMDPDPDPALNPDPDPSIIKPI